MKLIPKRGTIPGSDPPRRGTLLYARRTGDVRILDRYAPIVVPPDAAPGGRRLWRQDGAHRGRPIHLTATTEVAPNSSGSPNNQALHSPILGPIEITDIKFGFNIVLPGPQSPIYLAADGGSILCQLALNDELITNGYIPIWAFDESTNIVNEQTNGATGAASGPTTIYGEFTWHLPRPLYVRPADQINVSFMNQGQQAIVATCRVSLSGSVLENVTDPETRCLPYAATWVSKVFATASADADQSTELQLANVTDDAIHLQKMTGRVDNFGLPGGTAAAVAQHFDDPFGNADLGFSLSVQAYTGRGTQLIPYAVNFRDLFGPARSVPLSGILEPGDYIIAALAEAAVSGIYGQASIAMIGWREVAL
ncbi:MAG: hypothetical protein ACYC6M_03155 [Terriglobales bacterium]